MTYGLPDSAIVGTVKRADAFIRKSGFKHSPLWMEVEYIGWLTIFDWFGRLGSKKDKKAKSDSGLDPKFAKFTPRDIKAKKVRFRIVED